MNNKETTSIPKKTDEESRREFLINAGKMALYIPPAMMLLMRPSRNALACGSIVQHHHHRKRGYHHKGGLR